MALSLNSLEIVILCYKKDLYLTKICVSSIRYFYPNINIYLVKDEIAGVFSTKQLEKKFSVQVMDLGLKKYGWCTGKISLIVSEKLAGRKFLLLDTDIVFIGKVLDKLLPELDNTDFIVSPEYGSNPETAWFKRTYYDLNWAKSNYPDHEFPGYTFNCGQMVVTPGKISANEIVKYISFDSFPYWTEIAGKQLPCRDQSLLNILYPLKFKRQEIRMLEIPFQLWSESLEIKELTLEQIAYKNGYPFLIHWAGANRTPYLKAMTRSDILIFFQREYYKKYYMGEYIRIGLLCIHMVNYYTFGKLNRVIVKPLKNIASKYARKLKDMFKGFVLPRV